MKRVNIYDLYHECITEASQFTDRHDPVQDTVIVNDNNVLEKMSRCETYFKTYYLSDSSYDAYVPKPGVDINAWKKMRYEKDVPGKMSVFLKNSVKKHMFSPRSEAQLIGCFCFDKNGKMKIFKYAGVYSEEKLTDDDIEKLGLDYYNKYRSGQYDRYGNFKEYKPFKHAEIKCVLEMKKRNLDPKDFDFYLIGFRPSNKNDGVIPVKSNPCGNCMRMLNFAGWNHIYFLDKDNKVKEVIHGKHNETIA